MSCLLNWHSSTVFSEGPVELAAVGVSISVFNLVSKMFNIPLLNVTTSFVAEDVSEEPCGVGTKSQESESVPLHSADRKTLSIKFMTFLQVFNIKM